MHQNATFITVSKPRKKPYPRTTECTLANTSTLGLDKGTLAFAMLACCESLSPFE